MGLVTDRQTEINTTNRVDPWLWLTIPIAVLLAIASWIGFTLPDFYHRDTAYLAAQGVGQDFLNVVLILPGLLISGWLAARGSVRARVVWLGVLLYLVYSFTIYAVSAQFNQLFLVYVAILGCSFYAMVGGLVTAGHRALREEIDSPRSRKVVSIFLIVITVLFAALWLREIIPALIADSTPQSVIDNGTPTSVVHVLDLAILLPATLLTGIWLWQKRALAYTLAGALLINLAALGLAILSMIVFMAHAGQPVDMGLAVIFIVITLVDGSLAYWHLSKKR